MSTQCRHDGSLYGRCTACGKTWAEQAAERPCGSLHPEGGNSRKLHPCRLADNHAGSHENYLGTRVWQS